MLSYNTRTTHSLNLHQSFAHTIIILILSCLVLFPSGINSQKILFLVPHLSLTYVSINNFDHLVLLILCVFRYLFKCSVIAYIIVCKCIHTILHVLCTKLLNFYLPVIIHFWVHSFISTCIC